MNALDCWLLNVFCLVVSTSGAIILSPDARENMGKESSLEAAALIHRPRFLSENNPEGNVHQSRTYFTAYSCERSSLRLSCPSGMTIIPVHATYGRRNLHQCVEGQVDTDKWEDSCVASPRHTRRRIAQHCSMMANPGECIIPVFNEFFGRDPCPKTYKYLEVYYACD